MKLKRFVALSLSATMLLSMTACGSEKKSKKDGAVDTSSVETIGDALALAGDYKTGNSSIVLDFNVEAEGEEVGIKAEVSGPIDGQDFASDVNLSVDYQGATIEFAIEDAITAVDGRLYVDVDKFVEVITGNDETEFGSYGLLLPEIDDDALEDVTSEYQDISVGLIEAAVEDLDVEEKDGTFTVTIEDAADYKAVCDGVISYLDENRDDITDALNNANSIYTEAIDLEAYVNDLFDDVSSDVVSAAEVLGAEISEDDIAEVKEEALASISEYEGMLEEVEEVDYFEGFDSVVEEYESVTEDDFATILDETFDEHKITLSVTATEEKYEVSCGINFSGDGVVIDGTITSTLEVDDVKIEAPDNASTLTDMVTWATENPEVLESLMSDLQSSELYSAISELEGSYDYDDYDDYDDDYDDYDDDYDDYDDYDDEETDVADDGSAEFSDGYGTTLTINYDTDKFTLDGCDDYSIDFSTPNYDSIYIYPYSSGSVESEAEYYESSYEIEMTTIDGREAALVKSGDTINKIIVDCSETGGYLSIYTYVYDADPVELVEELVAGIQ